MTERRLRALQPGEQVVIERSDVAPDTEGALAFVREAEMGEGWLHPSASNFTFVVQLRLGADRGYGIYKPVRGEQPLWDFPRGLYRRECAAYEVAQWLGWPVVPPTAIRNDGELGVGSLQLFVMPQQDSNYFALREHAQEAVFQMAVFDIIVNNADRKGGHCFAAQTGGVWGVDHGLTFHEEYKLRTVIWDFAGEHVPTDWLDDARRLLDALNGDALTPLRQSLDALLTDEEVAALRHRAQSLLDEPVMPSPRSRRDLPWPWL